MGVEICIKLCRGRDLSDVNAISDTIVGNIKLSVYFSDSVERVGSAGNFLNWWNRCYH